MCFIFDLFDFRAAAVANSANNNSGLSIGGNSIADALHEQNDHDANDMRRVPSLNQFLPLNQVHEHHQNRRIDDDSGDSLQVKIRFLFHLILFSSTKNVLLCIGFSTIK